MFNYKIKLIVLSFSISICQQMVFSSDKKFTSKYATPNPFALLEDYCDSKNSASADSSAQSAKMNDEIRRRQLFMTSMAEEYREKHGGINIRLKHGEISELEEILRGMASTKSLTTYELWQRQENIRRLAEGETTGRWVPAFFGL